ncbi:retrovirus-related pol polyprotein from transposon tnt 1-94 [Lasius niger]|uniref:Retrovirus-related pol polyprotein from transposon tnt 1-94 n=1 Tax=Lasius niger TaxID=67767 RepID=A0A0J7NCC3_LASNI|nr:retrovirus-related pol polyprotein from transposon tnt 1-94 [Lasius niger]
MGKLHRLPFPHDTSKTRSIGEIVHADLCGPMPTKSFGGSKYYLLLKDDYSHYREVCFIESKTETTDCVEKFLKKAEKQCPKGVRVLRTDNGLEFVNSEMKELTSRLGIRHQRTVAY